MKWRIAWRPGGPGTRIQYWRRGSVWTSDASKAREYTDDQKHLAERAIEKMDAVVKTECVPYLDEVKET